MIVRKQGSWLAAKVDDALVMMSADHGHYLGLTEIGARIWELIAVPQTIEELCAQLTTEFDVTPETCRTEVDAFLRELEQHGAIAFD